MLAIAALASAGLAALITSPAFRSESRVSKAPDESTAGRDEAGPSKDSRPSLPGVGRVVAATDDTIPEQAFEHRMDLSDEERKALKVPTLDEARTQQKRSVEPRRDIVELGVDALLGEPRCTLPAVPVTSARSGAGILGCIIEDNAHGTIIVGRAGVRKPNGNLEIGDHEEGERSGTWEQYYPTGVLAAKGEYEDGQRSGVWDEYDEQGAHRFRRNYVEGRKMGATISYFGEQPRIELWSSVGQLDPQTKEVLNDERLAVAP
jgi:hypothetical protein